MFFFISCGSNDTEIYIHTVFLACSLLLCFHLIVLYTLLYTDSNEWVILSLLQRLKTRPIHLNQVCWSRETWKTCRAGCLEDQDRETLP